MFDREIDRRITAITRGQRGVIARRQLLAAGLAAGSIAARVRQERLFPVIRGVYALGPHVDTWGRRFAAVLAAGGEPLALPPLSGAQGDPIDPFGNGSDRAVPNAPPAASLRARSVVALSHASALEVHGLTDRRPVRHHVTVEGTGTRRQRAVLIHRSRRLHPEDLLVINGLPVTSPARTIVDIAATTSTDRLRRLIREAEYQRLIGPGAITAVLDRSPGLPGAPAVRFADPEAAESRVRQTPIEDRMTAVLERLPLPLPEPQVLVVGRSGRRYRADFAWADVRLIVETDGRSSHDRSTSFQSDRDRDADLAAAGWLTLRFTWLQLDDPERVASTILATARTRR